MAKFEHGLGIIIDPGADAPLREIPTTQCVHCGSHFPMPQFGTDALSKKLRIGRGFCQNCSGFICGEKCQECVPLEKSLDIEEGTRNPTAVSNTKRTEAPPIETAKLWLPQ